MREYFKCSKVFNIEGNSSVMTNLAISSSEENLICATANCQMYTFTLSNTDILKEDSMNFELLATSFHGPGPTGSAQITGLDVCIWKPLVATCGRDKTLCTRTTARVSNIPNSKTTTPSSLSDSESAKARLTVEPLSEGERERERERESLSLSLSRKRPRQNSF